MKVMKTKKAHINKQKKIVQEKCPKCKTKAEAELKYPWNLYRTIRNGKMLVTYSVSKLGKTFIDSLLSKCKLKPWKYYREITSGIKVEAAKKIIRTAYFTCPNCKNKFTRKVKMNSTSDLKKKIKGFGCVIKGIFKKLPLSQRKCYFCRKTIKPDFKKMLEKSGRNLITWHHVNNDHFDNSPDNLWLAHVACHKSKHEILRSHMTEALKPLLASIKGDVELLDVDIQKKGALVILTVFSKNKIKSKKKPILIEPLDKKNRYKISIKFKLGKNFNDDLIRSVVVQKFDKLFGL